MGESQFFRIMSAPPLLSTDFDGTLIRFESNGECVPELAAALSAWKAAGGLWLVNTGRSTSHFLEGLERLEAPVSPDFAVLNERHVYRASGADWEPDAGWNSECDRIHAELSHRVRVDLEKALRALPFFEDMVVVREHGTIAGIVTPDEATMDKAASALDALREPHPDFDYQRNAVYLRFSHRAYTKGSALGRVAGELRIPRDRILAIGDNHNDRPMLDGTFAFPACPANSIPEIKALVQEAGGWILDEDAGLGVARAITRFLREFASES